MALELIKGTDVPIVEVIKMAKDLYIKRLKKVSTKTGMCECIEDAIYDLVRDSGASIQIFDTRLVTKFSRSIAMTNFNASWCNLLWWPIEDSESRLKYFDWLIAEYSKEI